MKNDDEKSVAWEPTFKVGDQVVIRRGGAVGKVIDIEWLDEKYLVLIGSGEWSYGDSELVAL